jgi:hypothetical protein
MGQKFLQKTKIGKMPEAHKVTLAGEWGIVNPRLGLANILNKKETKKTKDLLGPRSHMVTDKCAGGPLIH